MLQSKGNIKFLESGKKMLESRRKRVLEARNDGLHKISLGKEKKFHMRQMEPWHVKEGETK